MNRLAACLVLGLAACGESGSFFADPTGPLPASITALGFASDGAASPELREYAPMWPLWSSGSAKSRWAFLPAPIVATPSGAWEFPVGASFFKTFAYARVGGGTRPIETRVLRRLDDGWTYDAYQWNEAGTDATLLGLQSATMVAVEDPDGAFVHRIPNRLDCRTCHESAASPVLGFAELQLDDDTLEGLEEAGLRASPTAPPERLVHADPATLEILGLFQGNCVHCHNGSGRGSASFDLRYPVALANTLDHPTESSASASGIRIVPGDPANSILFQAYSGETEDPAVKLMPPLGVDRRDALGIETLREWIAGLTLAAGER